jgi:hypothetical protein
MSSIGKILGSLGMTRSAVRFVSALGMTAAVITGVTVPVITADARAISAAALPKTGTASAYTAQSPNRILDTRSTGQRLTGGTLNLTVAGGTTTVPASAGAVVLNVTVTGTVGAGFLTIWPAGTVMPTASNLNWAAGEVRPNLVTVQVGTSGQVSLFANSPTDVVVDEEGYYGTPSGTAGGYVAVTPARITDTRAGSGQANAGSTLGAGSTLTVQVTGAGGVPTTGVSGVVLNATVTNTTGSSFLTVWPNGNTMPVVSNLNWVPGWTVPNRVTVPVGTGGKVSFYNKFGSTDLVVDVDGYYTDATASGVFFVPQNPTRVIDTRIQGGTLGAGGSSTYQVTGFAGVPAGASAALFNTTVTNTTASSFLTVYPGGGARPLASDLNWVAGQTIPNMTVATLSSAGSVSFYNLAGSTDLVVDLFGYFGTASSTGIAISVSASPSSVPADGASTSTVTATVTNNGSPLQGDAVRFTTSGTCGSVSPVTGNTSNVGKVSTTYTASSTTGTCTVTATEANKAQTASTTITQTAPPNTVTVTSTKSNVLASGTDTATVTAHVANPSGTSVSGDSVTWTASGTCGSVNPGSGSTDSSGNVSTVYISSTTTGFCTIKGTEAATGGSGSTTIAQTVSPKPTGMATAATSTNNAGSTGCTFIAPATVCTPADGATTLTETATVTCTPGTCVAANANSDPVRWTTSASVSGSCGTLTPSTGTTDSTGKLSVTYTPSTTQGQCTVTATEANGFTAGSVTIQQTAPPNVVSVSANPSTMVGNGSNSSTITATVTTSSGTPVSGDVVTFNVPPPSGTCGTLSSNSATTNASGVATIVYISATSAGFCTITAREASTGATGTVVITQTT